jgi:thiol-disulfide isomerase/thioredoxin
VSADLATRPPAWQRALRGAFEGGCGAVLACLISYYSGNVRGSAFWYELLVFGLAGAFTIGAGRAIADGLLGAIVGGVAGLLLGLVVGEAYPGRYTTTRQAPLRTGPVMELKGPTPDGKQFDLDKWRGKVVVVDFWATWCVPCREGLPALREVYQRNHERGMEMVGFPLEHDPPSANKKAKPSELARERGRVTRQQLKKFVDKNEMRWPQVVLDDAEQRDVVRKKHNVDSVPTFFVLDREGRVVSWPDGQGNYLAHGSNALQVESVVNALLEAKGDGPASLTFEHQIPLGLYTALLVGLALGGLAGAVIQRRFSPERDIARHRARQARPAKR